MENIIYNELLTRDFEIDIGTIETREKQKKHRAETGFICNLGYKRYYIKYVPHLNTREETLKEESLFMKIKDNFKKAIVVNDNIKHYYTEEGILIIGIVEFLQNKYIFDLNIIVILFLFSFLYLVILSSTLIYKILVIFLILHNYFFTI